MKFYTQIHRHYCGIDLHARCLYICILDQEGNPLIHKNIKATPAALLKIIAPYRDDPVIGVQCMFSWLKSQGIADLKNAGNHDSKGPESIRSGHLTAPILRAPLSAQLSQNLFRVVLRQAQDARYI